MLETYADIRFMARMLGLAGVALSPDKDDDARSLVIALMSDPFANARAQGRIQGLLAALPTEE